MQFPILIKRAVAAKIPVRLKLRAVRNSDRLGPKPRRARALIRRVLQVLDPILPH